YFAPAAPAMPLVTDHKLQPLVVASAKRGITLPDVPTTTEEGYANADYEFWVGAFVTAATPRPLVDRINAAFVKALQSDEVRARLKSMGGPPTPMSPDEFERQVRREIGINAEIVKAVHLEPQ